MGKGNTVVQEEKTSLKMCILVPSTVMSSWESVAAVSCSCLTDAIPQKNYWPSKIYIQEIIVYCAWSHLPCTPMELLPASHCMFINGVRAWTYMEQWSSSTTLHRSQSLCVTDFVGKDCWPSSSPSTYDAATPSSLTFIFVYDYIFNIYIHPSIATSSTVLL